MLFLLAIRNIFANARRSFIVFLVLTMVCAILFLFMTFSDGEIQNMDRIQAAITPNTDVLLLNKEFARGVKRGEAQWEKTVADSPAIMERLREWPEVKAAFAIQPVLNLDVAIKGKKFSVGPLMGLDKGDHAGITDMLELEARRFISENDAYAIMLRTEMAADAGIAVGDEVTVTGRDLFSQAVSQKFKVAGFFRMKMDNPNLGRMGYLDMTGFCMVSGLYDGEANRIGLTLKKGNSPDGFISKYAGWIGENYPDLFLSTDEAVYGKQISLYRMLRYIFTGCIFIVLLIVSIGIMNVVSVNLYDRKKEIGTYYCLGAGRPYLICMYTAEMLLVNLAGAVTGIGIGLIIRQIIMMMNITTAEPGVQLVFGGSHFTLGFSADSILTVLIGIFIVTLFSAVFTLNGSLKVSPSVAIRETGD